MTHCWIFKVPSRKIASRFISAGSARDSIAHILRQACFLSKASCTALSFGKKESSAVLDVAGYVGPLERALCYTTTTPTSLSTPFFKIFKKVCRRSILPIRLFCRMQLFRVCPYSSRSSGQKSAARSIDFRPSITKIPLWRHTSIPS